MSINKYYGQILTSDNLLEIRLRHFPNHEDLEILLGFLEDRETVLDLGCGTGFTCEFLAKCGKNVTGVEPTEEYIIDAKIRVQDLDFADRLDFQIGDMEGEQTQNSFDAVIFMWGVINEAPTRDAQLEILKKYRSYLKPNGLLYIDTIYIPEEFRPPFVIFEDPVSRFELIDDEFNVRVKHPGRESHIIRCNIPSGWKNMFNLAGYNTVILCGYKCADGIRRLVVVGIEEMMDENGTSSRSALENP